MVSAIGGFNPSLSNENMNNWYQMEPKTLRMMNRNPRRTISNPNNNNNYNYHTNDRIIKQNGLRMCYNSPSNIVTQQNMFRLPQFHPSPVIPIKTEKIPPFSRQNECKKGSIKVKKELHSTNDVKNRQSPVPNPKSITIKEEKAVMTEDRYIVKEEKVIKKEENVEDSPIDLTFDRPILKERRQNLINCIFQGKQCSSCGIRFSPGPEQSKRYGEHLDWHFRTNRQIKLHASKSQSRGWFLTESDWIKLGDHDNVISQQEFPKTGLSLVAEKSSNLKKLQKFVVPSKGHTEKICFHCGEEFKEYFDQEIEEWVFRNSKLVDIGNDSSQLFHPNCYSDYLKNPCSFLLNEYEEDDGEYIPIETKEQPSKTESKLLLLPIENIKTEKSDNKDITYESGKKVIMTNSKINDIVKQSHNKTSHNRDTESMFSIPNKQNELRISCKKESNKIPIKKEFNSINTTKDTKVSFSHSLNASMIKNENSVQNVFYPFPPNSIKYNIKDSICLDSKSSFAGYPKLLKSEESPGYTTEDIKISLQQGAVAKQSMKRGREPTPESKVIDIKRMKSEAEGVDQKTMVTDVYNDFPILNQGVINEPTISGVCTIS